MIAFFNLTALCRDFLIAARKGEAQVLTRFLEDGMDTGIRNELGQTALHLAILGAHNDAVAVLLGYGASLSIADDEGKTPADLIVCNDEMMEFVLNTLQVPVPKVNHATPLQDDDFVKPVVNKQRTIREETKKCDGRSKKSRRW